MSRHISQAAPRDSFTSSLQDVLQQPRKTSREPRQSKLKVYSKHATPVVRLSSLEFWKHGQECFGEDVLAASTAEADALRRCLHRRSDGSLR